MRIYKDWKIKEEMYYLNQELKKVSSTYITQEEYQKISNDFLEGKYSTLKEEWDSFAESVFFENDVAFQTVDAELFFNDSTLLKERINKRLLDYIPQLLLAIGIFGTFFGLVLGLSGLDLSAGDNTQLNNLINGTKISFLTSTDYLTALSYRKEALPSQRQSFDHVRLPEQELRFHALPIQR